MGKHWSNQTHKEFKGPYVLSLFLLFRNLYSLIALERYRNEGAGLVDSKPPEQLFDHLKR